MKKKIWISLLVLTVSVAFCLMGAPKAQAGPVKMTYSCFFPPTHANSKLAEAWCEEIEKRTGGKVQIAYYPGQTLTKGTQCYDGVVNGISDIGFSILQYTPGRFPVMDVINLPIGIPSGTVATAILNEINEKFQPKELNDTKVMYLHSHGPGLINTKEKPVRKMEDLKGLKIRSHGPTAEMIKHLGGTPVALPMPELYQALQKGVVQGGVFPLEAQKGWRLAEVTDYTSACFSTAYGLGFFVVMNKDKWNSLPPDVQKTIEEINIEWTFKQGQIWDDIDFKGVQFLLSKGNTIVGVDDKEAARRAKAVKPVMDAYAKNLEAKGLPGKEVLEFVQKRLKDANKGKFTSKYMAGGN